MDNGVIIVDMLIEFDIMVICIFAAHSKLITHMSFGTRKLYYLLKSRQSEMMAYDIKYGLSSFQRKTPFMLIGNNDRKAIMIWEVLPALEYVRDNNIHANIIPMFMDMLMEHPHLPYIALEPTARYVAEYLNNQYAVKNSIIRYVYHPIILDNQQTIFQIIEELSI